MIKGLNLFLPGKIYKKMAALLILIRVVELNCCYVFVIETKFISFYKNDIAVISTAVIRGRLCYIDVLNSLPLLLPMIEL